MTDSEKLNLILSKLDTVDKRLDTVDKRLDTVDKRLDTVDRRLDTVDKHLDTLDKRTTVIENSITDIKLTLENEIRVNIQRVAEGHLDLSRKLNECIKISSDIKDKQEIQDIYINMHNNKLRAIQA